jgi:hypothetical protein
MMPDLQSFIETASAFENTGSGLYHGALLNVTQTQEYFPTAAGLAAVESRHASWLNSPLGEWLVPDFAPVEAPISQAIVLSRVAEFVTDARSTFPSFDTLKRRLVACWPVHDITRGHAGGSSWSWSWRCWACWR